MKADERSDCSILRQVQFGQHHCAKLTMHKLARRFIEQEFAVVGDVLRRLGQEKACSAPHIGRLLTQCAAGKRNGPRPNQATEFTQNTMFLFCSQFGCWPNSDLSGPI
jgi:hypothetical protein